MLQAENYSPWKLVVLQYDAVYDWRRQQINKISIKIIGFISFSDFQQQCLNVSFHPMRKRKFLTEIDKTVLS